MDLEDLEELAGKLISFPSRIPTTPEPRPSLRKPRRSKPDCGGLRDAADLAEVLADPARFDLDEINEGLNQ